MVGVFVSDRAEEVQPACFKTHIHLVGVIRCTLGNVESCSVNILQKHPETPGLPGSYGDLIVYSCWVLAYAGLLVLSFASLHQAVEAASLVGGACTHVHTVGHHNTGRH